MRFIIKYGGEFTKTLAPQTGLNQNNRASRLPGTGNHKKMIVVGSKDIVTLWPQIPWVSAVLPRVFAFWKQIFLFFLWELSKCLELWEYKIWPITGFLVGQGSNWIQGFGTGPSNTEFLVSLGKGWGAWSPGSQLALRSHCWVYGVLEECAALFLKTCPLLLPRTLLNKHECTLCLISWS